MSVTTPAGTVCCFLLLLRFRAIVKLLQLQLQVIQFRVREKPIITGDITDYPRVPF